MKMLDIKLTGIKMLANELPKIQDELVRLQFNKSIATNAKVYSLVRYREDIINEIRNRRRNGQ